MAFTMDSFWDSLSFDGRGRDRAARPVCGSRESRQVGPFGPPALGPRGARSGHAKRPRATPDRSCGADCPSSRLRDVQCAPVHVGDPRIWRRLETMMQLTEFADIWMIRKMLLNVKQRAESLERVEVLAARLALGPQK